jgi:two-component system, NtrC family, sensor kinase
MSKPKQQTVNIGIVGGGTYCKEVLNKYVIEPSITSQYTEIIAVVDRDHNSPGIKEAQKLAINTLDHHEELYDPRYKIDIIIILEPGKDLLDEIISTRPLHIRILSFEVFMFLWQDLGHVEFELKTRNKEMETILNHIQDFIVVISPEMEIIEINQAFSDYMGYSRDKIIGQKCYEVLQKKNHRCHINDDTFCPINDVIRNRQPSRRTSLRQIDHNGKPRHLDVIIYPIWEKDGKISKFIEIGRDVTELKNEQEKITSRLEKMVKDRTSELQDTHAKLLHQDKMSSLGKLSAAVVHEINNPISGILNLIMLMKRIHREGDLNKKDIVQFTSYLDLMETETKRISRIVSNLLAFSRQSKIELKRLNINDLVERTIVMNLNLIKINNIEIDKQLEENLPKMLGAEDQLQQVLMNLISNAIEAMESSENKQLKITTEYSLAENTVTLSVSDSGVGIPRELFPKLYEPFFTTKKKGKGVGLGLSLVYGIVHKHKGHIDLESDSDRGTTFVINLPIDSDVQDSDGNDEINMMEF